VPLKKAQRRKINERDAQVSTGPKTELGKRISSQKTLEDLTAVAAPGGEEAVCRNEARLTPRNRD
jgi:hypothetical protein